MIPLTELWLPILLSAVFVFVASSVIHMALPIHRGDYRKLPDEDALLEALRAHGLQPGHYMFPLPASMKDMNTPEMREKYQRGPVGTMTVLPNGPPAIGTNLILWFLYSVLIGIFVAYIGSLALPRGAEYRAVFRVCGTVAILAYALASVPESIWKGQRWGVTLKFIFDGVVYGLVTAGTFGWLWPEAA
jgi:hypothetical protein